MSDLKLESAHYPDEGHQMQIFNS